MKTSMKKLAVALAAAMLGTVAMAATESGQLDVSASVAGSCAVGDATLAFTVAATVNADGTGSQTSGDVTSSTTVNVVCTNGQSGALSAGNGGNYDAADGRRLSDGGGTPVHIKYGLYSDNTHATTFDATNTIGVVGTGTTEAKTIYGKIAAADAQAAPKGSYTDIVALTITYTP